MRQAKEPTVMYLQHSATSAGPGIPMTPADLVELGTATGSRLRIVIRSIEAEKRAGDAQGG